MVFEVRVFGYVLSRFEVFKVRGFGCGVSQLGVSGRGFRARVFEDLGCRDGGFKYGVSGKGF